MVTTARAKSLTDAALPDSPAALKRELSALVRADKDLTTEIDAKTQTRNEIRWRKAADVYAYTEEGTAGRKPGGKSENPTDSTKLSLTAFSKLGIDGFKDRKTITAYRKTWQKAIDDGVATAVEPGDMVQLPEVDFQAYWEPPSTDRPKAENKNGPVETSHVDGHEPEEAEVMPVAVAAIETVTAALSKLSDDELETVKNLAMQLIDAVSAAQATRKEPVSA